MKLLTPFRGASSRGFTLIEMIVVVFLLALAMLGILSVFDASARINKSESDVADAQGAVRYGIYSMSKAIRMAGSGGLYISQAVLNHADPDASLPGITVVNSADANSYDNVEANTTVTALDRVIQVRPGTDMIEIRGVINSPLLGFDLSTGCEPCNPVTDPSGGCAPCTGSRAVDAAATTHTPHVNDDVPNRQQFSQIDDYTAGATAANPMFVLVAFNDDMHPNCTTLNGNLAYALYPQPPYNVGTIVAPTHLAGLTPTFGTVNFADARAMQFNSAPGGTETPLESGAPAQALKNVRHAGIMDDMIFFIDNGTDPLHQHPSLAQGIRRGNAFDVVTLADDVEDMQIAYGVDIDGNGDINRIAAATASDADSNVSSVAQGDEWVPNVPGDDNPIVPHDHPFKAADFYDTPNHCPRLHAVMISLVAKSHDPDLTYRRAPAGLGLRTMNSPVLVAPPHPDTAQYPGLANASFRRRVQTLKINLRNYSFQGLTTP